MKRSTKKEQEENAIKYSAFLRIGKENILGVIAWIQRTCTASGRGHKRG